MVQCALLPINYNNNIEKTTKALLLTKLTNLFLRAESMVIL